ncbi:MAG: hypothetical protein H6747_16280 [Deltaproteobacteria bacterium]|nr:hypothetical protein [Deltaproteobacteria bacterium]
MRMPRLSRSPLWRALLAASAAGLLLSGCGGLLQDRADRRAELKIRKVVLFQNGVGYFERRGKVEGDKLDLHVRPDQVNDVLKSLTILHLGEGRTSSVTLPVERSADRLAAELPAAVRNARGLVGLLQVLRGVEVTVSTRDDDHRGRVVGVEKGAGKGGKRVTLLVAEKKLVSVAVDKVKRVRIHDRALASGLARSLDISKSDGQWKPVSLTVHLDGKGPHDMLVGYIHEVPIWRPAYRAWVEKDRGVRLQGWAIVDNVSGEDWKNVRLSLVVGSPLSFRYELHRPHHVRRPDLSSRLPQTSAAPPPPDVGYAAADDEVEEAEGDGAPMMEKSTAAAGLGGLRGMGAGGGGSGRARIGRPMAKRAMPRPSAPPRTPPMEPDVDLATRRAALARSAQAMAEGRKMGQLYRYDALAPVTVGDGQAALVHIVDKKVKGADVFLFRSLSSGETPYRSLLIENPKGSAMESGPITLYVDGTFAGEGFLGRIDEGATTFVPFAAADGFALTARNESKTEAVRLMRAHGGQITVESKHRLTRTITIKSERDEASVCYVKIGLHGHMKLEQEPKGMVRAGNDVYVRVEVPKKGEGKTEIVESSTTSRTSTWLNHAVLEAFELYLKDTTIADALKGPVRELIALNEELAALGSKRNDAVRRRHELEVDARRIRRNLDSLPMERVADKLRKTLVDQLDANTKQAAEAAKTIVELDVAIAAVREKMTGLIKQLEIR